MFKRRTRAKMHKPLLLLAVFEAVLIHAGFGATLWFWDQTLPAAQGARELAVLLSALPATLACVLGLYLADLYDIATLRRGKAQFTRVPRAICCALLVMLIGYAVMYDLRVATRPLAIGVVAAFALATLLRVVFGGSIRRSAPERVLVLGSGTLARRIVAAVSSQSQPEHVVVAMVGVAGEMPRGRTQIETTVSSSEQLDEALRESNTDRIAVAVSDRKAPLPLRQLLEGRLHGIAVEDGGLFYERLTGSVPLEALAPSSVAFGDGFRVPRLDAAFARGLGLIAATVGLLLVAPLLLLVALAIRIDSPGPVLFVQPRIGKDGVPFDLLKFRTMRVADRKHSEWAGANEKRITRIGRVLRRFRIDELPQLVNVLRGEMNLVGPRPHPDSNHALFSARIPYYTLRSLVQPGITGWAQVRYGYANNLAEEIEKMRYDLYYIRHVSVWLDLRVLLATVRVVLRGQEANDADVQQAHAELSRSSV